MAEVNANNVANVSSTKGVKGGYIFTAPANTPLPTDYKTQLPQQWKTATPRRWTPTPRT